MSESVKQCEVCIPKGYSIPCGLREDTFCPQCSKCGARESDDRVVCIRNEHPLPEIFFSSLQQMVRFLPSLFNISSQKGIGSPRTRHRSL